MADLITVRFEDNKGILEGRIENLYDVRRARQLLKDAIDDIADHVEAEAKHLAPEETGALKLHPVDRSDTEISETPSFFRSGFGKQTEIPAFGGGTSVRGPGGRFIKPTLFQEPVFIPGGLLARSVITIPQEPRHAIWVHNGTGIYGPRKRLITAKVPGQRMKFRRWSKAIDRRPQWRLESVKGQAPQPYLENAFLFVDGTFVPARIELLRAQIAGET